MLILSLTWSIYRFLNIDKEAETIVPASLNSMSEIRANLPADVVADHFLVFANDPGSTVY